MFDYTIVPSDVEFDAYALYRVPIGIEHISITYHDVPNDWNKSTAKKNIYATNLTPEEEDNAFLIKNYQRILMNK